MKAHGEYRIEVIENIVHVFPTGDFNAQGISALHKEISELAPKGKAWALFEHPYNYAGLTPEAIDELIQSYNNLAKINCVVAALEISTPWQHIFESLVLNKVNIPIFLDSCSDKLALNINETLRKLK